MTKTIWMTIMTMLGLALTFGPALAQGHGQGRDKDKDKDAKVEHRSGDRDGDHDRDDHVRQVAHHPPGWDHGRKTGWGGCDVPPGQAKKVGCHPYGHPSHRTVQTSGVKPVAVHRPTAEVHAHAGVDANIH